MNVYPPCCIALQQGGILLQYDLLFGNCISGNVYVSELGLYYKISVICSLPKEGIYKAVAVTDRGRVPVGVLTPQNDQFAVEKKISKKVLCDEIVMFEAVNIAKNTFLTIPLNPEVQFPDLEKLDSARLVFAEGIAMLEIQDLFCDLTR